LWSSTKIGMHTLIQALWSCIKMEITAADHLRAHHSRLIHH
jgi:hypothetical protein